VFSWQGSTLVLDVYVCPNAKSDEFIGPYEGAIKIKITAPAKENKANTHIIKLLSKCFNVPKSAVTLVKGLQSKQKRFHINNPKSLPDWISHEC
jgi:uncharacterized protein